MPQWLARPASVLSTLTALVGAGLVFWAAVTGGYWWAIWGVVSFIGAGLLWYLADYAGLAVPAESPKPGGR
jgi:hypothetical protein